MLTEEALILLATLGASGLLVLGVAELAWPSRPRGPARRARLAPPERARAPAVFEADATVEVAVADAPASAPASGAEPSRRAAPRAPRAPRTTDARRSTPPVDPPPVADPVSAPIASGPMPVPAHVEEPRGRDVSPEPEPPRPQVLPIDTCRAMYRDGRFAEVVSLGSAALEVHARLAAVSDRPHEAAALLDLVGLSKQELGDRDGARAAFHAAILDAEAAVRPTYVRRLVTLAGQLVARAGEPADGEADAARVRALRGCAVALEDALGAEPGDEGVLAAQAAVRDALSPVCERLVARVVSGESDDRERALVLEVLADEAMPAAWRDRLREQLAAASSAEIGQLTAHAIRSVQDGRDGEALEALERAERLAAALPSDAVADERREEFERRLWWGYTKVGMRRVEVGNFDGALEPLFRALRLGGIDEERLGETRSALVRALDGVVDTRWPAIQQLGAADAGAARVEIEKLSALLRTSTERGLTSEELGDTFAKVTHLGQTLSQMN